MVKTFFIFMILLLILLYSMSINRIREIVIPPIIKYFPGASEIIASRNDFLFKQFGALLPSSPATILNFGCSYNSFSDHLVQKGYNVVALDVVDVSVANVPVIVYDGEDLESVSLPRIDCALVSLCFHHIPRENHTNLFKQLLAKSDSVVLCEDLVCDAGKCNRNSICVRCMMHNVQFFGHPRAFGSEIQWERMIHAADGHVMSKSKNQEECIVAYKCVSCKTKPTEPTAHRGEAIAESFSLQSREKLGTSLSGEEIVT